MHARNEHRGLGAREIQSSHRRVANRDPLWLKWSLIIFASLIVGVLIVLPVVNVFVEALKDGLGVYWKVLVHDDDTLQSILLTFKVVPVALAMNIIFGITAAWAITRFDFPGRTFLTALIDLPFSVSPVVAGLMLVLIFGLQGYLGPFLRNDGYSAMPYLVSALSFLIFAFLFYLLRPPISPLEKRPLISSTWFAVPLGGTLVFGITYFLQTYFHMWPQAGGVKIIFATPGLIIATAFVTVPFVARELIPVMEALGPDEELAAVSLGATGWQMFWHVTLPNIKWGLVYGIILCNARAMGEFGAVYVVSGHISGQTDTMPLRIEKLFQEYNLTGAFAVASVLTFLALLTLIAKVQIERVSKSDGREEKA